MFQNTMQLIPNTVCVDSEKHFESHLQQIVRDHERWRTNQSE